MREVHRNTGLPQETRKKISNSLTYHLKELQKGQTKSKVKKKKKKEIIKIREEINKIVFKNNRTDQ